MNRPRRDLTASEVVELHDRLARQLEKIGLATQPKVAARLLELSQNPRSEIRQYVDAIKTDWTLTGRLLKLANSAYYAQRNPVTSLDRALVVLGLERTKAVSMGFYLCRAASGMGDKGLSRAVWGESVYRAGLCSALAQRLCPKLAAEAFVVGLMLDCGQPLMARLLGDGYATMRATHGSPAKLFAAEFGSLEFTHVDVAAVMMKRWRMPGLLARPITWHHALPQSGRTSDPGALLQRLAYYAGAVQLSPAGVPEQSAPLASIANRLFEIDTGDLAGLIGKATAEYRATIDLFSDVADTVAQTEKVAEAVQMQLIALMDEQMGRQLHADTRGGAVRLSVAGQNVEIEPGREGEVVAVISTASGDPLISCTVKPETDGAEVLCSRLGLDQVDPIELQTLMAAVRKMAA
ncbi:MAG: HDOD domain-containing protein [Phycisphaerales bacterium]